MTHPKEDGFSITHREGDQPVSNPYKFADTQPLSNPQTFDAEIAWLTEAARYFANRPTGGEDRAHWANVYNAENANKLASRIEAMSRRPAMEAVAWRFLYGNAPAGCWSYSTQKPDMADTNHKQVQALAVIPTQGPEANQEDRG